MSNKKIAAAGETYEREELAAQAERLFGVRPEAVAGALRGTDRYTLDDAKRAVDHYLKRKVL